MHPLMRNAKGWGKMVLGLSYYQALHKPISKTNISEVTDAGELPSGDIGSGFSLQSLIPV